jgi:hypothetical protein
MVRISVFGLGPKYEAASRLGNRPAMILNQTPVAEGGVPPAPYSLALSFGSLRIQAVVSP